MDDESVPVQVRLEVPLWLILNGALAQLGELLFCTQEVRGSIPLSSTTHLVMALLLGFKRSTL